MNGTMDCNDTSSLLAEFSAVEALNSLPYGAYVTDRERKIVFWNRAAERITGWKQAEVVSRTCSENLLVHVDKDGHRLCGHEHCPLHRSIVTNKPSTDAVLIFAQVKSGARKPVEVSVAPIHNHSGEVVGGIEVFQDLTESMRNQLQARKIQQATMHCELPQDDRVMVQVRYLSRDLVGGDFYRVERFGGARYAAMLVDAKGHGVSAALYTMLLRSIWDAHCMKLASSARFMQEVNRSVRSVMGDAAYFGTGVCADYDAATGKLGCVLAGHPDQLLFRADGRIETAGKFNTMLGFLDEVTYEETVTQLEPGDTLLLFSDGATELFDAGGRDLGVDGLKRLVQEQTGGVNGADFNLERLEEQLLLFSNQIHLPDDLTLIKLRRLR
jgi:PAS domain S-box-containing protein